MRLQKLKKNRLGFVGYQLKEDRGVLLSLGVPILLVGQDKSVCGGCYLLLRSLALRCSLLSHFKDLPQMSSLLPVLSLTSSDGCRLTFLTQPRCLFPSCQKEGGFTFTACCLECRKSGAIIKKVEVPPLYMDENEKNAYFKNYGAMVSLISDRLTALPDWRITYQNMS